MAPVLAPGDWVEVIWQSSVDLKSSSINRPDPFSKGDLVVARLAEQDWVVHRLISASPANLKIKGDAAWSSEEVTRAQLWGKVNRVIPAARAHALNMDPVFEDFPDVFSKAGKVWVPWIPVSSLLDRLIAWISPWNDAKFKWRGRLARRFIYPLGLLRRQWLSRM